jgi:peptide deformylase
MKTKNLLFLIFTIVFVSCQSTLTKAEKELINSACADEPFVVLLTANLEDSLFLRTQSTDIKRIKSNPDLDLLIKRMRATLIAERGVGLAAPQIGIARNLFLITRLDKPDRPVEVMINPRIVAHSDEMISFEGDGCLSILELSGNSQRYKWLDVEYYNEYGEKINERLQGGYSRFCDFTNIIFQHEYDHLRGVLFLDRLGL